MNWLKWLYPGIGIKRWIVLGVLGMMLVIGGLIVILGPGLLFDIGGYLMNVSEVFREGHNLGIGLVIAAMGLALLLFAVVSIIRAVVVAHLPAGMRMDKDLVDALVERRILSKGPNIVAIGGGTGLSVLLRGLRQLSSNLTAIVTVADDGGSSGRLRELDLPAPGDIRNCILALANADEPMKELFNYRYDDNIVSDGLRGHSFGNLLIATLTQITGDFSDAVQMACSILAVRGKVVPSTDCEDIQLCAQLDDGRIVCGETEVGSASKPIKKVFLQPDAIEVTPDAIEALREADLIIMGPGSLYTSIIATLLVPGIAEAIRKSDAHKIYVCNAMTQVSETLGYTVYDHVKAIVDHVGLGIVDTVFVNTATIEPFILQRYKEEGAGPVTLNEEEVCSLGVDIVAADLIEQGDVVRHSQDKVNAQIVNLLWRSR